MVIACMHHLPVHLPSGSGTIVIISNSGSFDQPIKVGECGLDYSYKECDRDDRDQREVFILRVLY